MEPFTLSRAPMSAPLDCRKRITSVCPPLAAMCTAVSPCCERENDIDNGNSNG